jgi:tRNA A37 methylthiotransferase MiaB
VATFYVENFGCRATQADGAAIERQFAEHGLDRASSPTTAQVVVLNTCTVTAAADQDARAAIRRIHRQNPGCQIVVTGCYAQRSPAEIAALPGVTQVVGNSHKHVLAELTLASAKAAVNVPAHTAGLKPYPDTNLRVPPAAWEYGPSPASPVSRREAVPTPASANFIPLSRLIGNVYVSDIFAHTELLAAPVFDTANERTRPILKVQDGCDNRCSFCIIPSVRGHSRSLPLEEVLREVNALAEAGYREVVLSGINLGRWGRDLECTENALARGRDSDPPTRALLGGTFESDASADDASRGDALENGAFGCDAFRGDAFGPGARSGTSGTLESDAFGWRSASSAAKEGLSSTPALAEVKIAAHKLHAKKPYRLETLIRAILDYTPLEKLRISSVEPMDWSDELIHLMATSHRIAKHAHVPLQSGSDAVLRRMHRRYRPWHYREKIEKIRSAMPTAAIGADVMAGFPGETEAEFSETRRLIEDLPFTYLHVFTYSPRPQTPAASRPDQVPVHTARERNRILRILSEQKKLAFMRTFSGVTLEAITLQVSHLEDQATFTEAITDNYLKLLLKGRHAPNRLLRAEIEGVQSGSLVGKIA